MRKVFKFSQALVIAAVLVGFAYLNSQLTHQRIFLIVLYLLLATIVPWLMVPLGLVAVLWSLFKSPGIVGWFQQVTGGMPTMSLPAKSQQAAPN